MRGSEPLDALAASSPRPVTRVQFVVTGGSLTDHVVATAARILIGWGVKWDTASVSNGSYTLQSVATEAGGTTVLSPPIDVRVDNGRA